MRPLSPALFGTVLVLAALSAPAPATAVGGCNTVSPALGQTVTCTYPSSGISLAVPTGATSMSATVLGAGGGGGGALNNGRGGVGAEGASVEALMDVTGLATITVQVGAGGSLGLATPTSGGAGQSSRLTSGSDDLVLAAGGGGGASAGICEDGAPGSSASGSTTLLARTVSAAISPVGGSAGGQGAVGSSLGVAGSIGSEGLITLSFSGLSSSPTSQPATTRHFTWQGQVSGTKSADLVDGTWQNTPTSQEWSRPGAFLLGWATDANFPVDRAHEALRAPSMVWSMGAA